MKQTEDLFLILKGQWYRMIEAGIKLEEYRGITPYWSKTRELGKRQYKTVTFQLGYRKNNRMTFKINKIEIGCGKENWGAEQYKKYFIINLGKRLS
jgi:hypothetical protein